MPRSKEPDTEELLARAKTGDERAGVEAIARQRERLRKMLATRMDKRLKARLDPSDVIQESIASWHRKGWASFSDRRRCHFTFG